MGGETSDILGSSEEVQEVYACMWLEVDRLDVLVRAIDEVWQGQSTVGLERGDHCTRTCVMTCALEPSNAVSLTVV